MVEIRAAETNDAAELTEIYRPYVERTAITYEYTLPDVTEFASRMENTLKKYPYLVAVEEGVIIGYAYAGAFIARAAYSRSVEVSIYIRQDKRGKGIGRLLYTELENRLSKMGITNTYACIAYPEKEDEYLNYDSMNFHKKMGYRVVGTFNKCAFKFNRWYGMIWMEKFIGLHK